MQRRAGKGRRPDRRRRSMGAKPPCFGGAETVCDPIPLPTALTPAGKAIIHPVKKGAVILGFHFFHKVFHTAANTCKKTAFRVKYS